jgi:hypothetical protein
MGRQQAVLKLLFSRIQIALQALFLDDFEGLELFFWLEEGMVFQVRACAIISCLSCEIILTSAKTVAQSSFVLILPARK